MMAVRSKAVALAVLLALAANVNGCALFKGISNETQTPVEDVYAAVRIAHALQEEALFIVQQPTTPNEAVQAIAVASAGLTLSADAAAKGALAYEDAMRAVAAIPTGTPEALDALRKADIAGLAARQFIVDVLNPAIDSFKALIASVKKGN